MRAHIPAALLLITMAVGCAGPQRIGGASGITVVDAASLPPPGRADLGSTRPYFVGPFDKLTIDVFGVEALSNREIQVDAGGRLTFPLIGEVEAQGRTPNEVALAIAERLRGRFIRNPQVSVNLRETFSQLLTVEGEVKEPGVYPVIGNVTLLQAIARAKGTTEFSRLSQVLVFRTVGDRRYAAVYDLRAIRNGNYADPEVYAGDVVAVGESQARRVFRDVLQTAPLLTTPLILLLQ
jgi:polysaccharide export outer membrane protein